MTKIATRPPLLIYILLTCALFSTLCALRDIFQPTSPLFDYTWLPLNDQSHISFFTFSPLTFHIDFPLKLSSVSFIAYNSIPKLYVFLVNYPVQNINKFQFYSMNEINVLSILVVSFLTSLFNLHISTTLSAFPALNPFSPLSDAELQLVSDISFRFRLLFFISLLEFFCIATVVCKEFYFSRSYRGMKKEAKQDVGGGGGKGKGEKYANGSITRCVLILTLIFAPILIRDVFAPWFSLEFIVPKDRTYRELMTIAGGGGGGGGSETTTVLQHLQYEIISTLACFNMLMFVMLKLIATWFSRTGGEGTGTGRMIKALTSGRDRKNPNQVCDIEFGKFRAVSTWRILALGNFVVWGYWWLTRALVVEVSERSGAERSGLCENELTNNYKPALFARRRFSGTICVIR